MLLALGCTPKAEDAQERPGTAAMANPASEYCVSQGGKLEIRRDDAGNETGMCHLSDGTAIEEWTLFRRDHARPQE